MKIHFLTLFVISSYFNFIQKPATKNFCLQTKVETLVYPKKGTSLGSYYSVDDIVAVEVINDWKNSKNILTGSKLDEFKNIMKTSVYRIGLETKPGHIFVNVKFKGEKNFSNDFIYLGSGINFDYGINKKGEKFAGTFRPNGKVNFEKY